MVNEENRGPSYFKKYLRYADLLNVNDEEGVYSIFKSLVNEEEKIVGVSEYDWIAEDVCSVIEDCLDNNVYSIKKKINVGSFVFDLGVYKGDEYVFGVELSGIREYSSPSKVSDGIYKNYYLMNRGWKIYKLWVSDWLTNREDSVTKLKEYLSNI